MLRSFARISSIARILPPVFVLFAFAQAWAGYIGNVSPMYSSPSHLANSVYAHVTFDYRVTRPEGVRFWIQPYYQGSVVSGYAWSGSSLVPAGYGTHSSWFTFLSGTHAVDQIQIQMVHPDTWAPLLEFYVPVEYTFRDHGIYNLDFSIPSFGCTSPSWLGRGRQCKIGFDYSSAWTGNVLIFARPFTNGSLTPGYTASGSPDLPPSGHAEQWFTFNNSDADVTHVRFQMLKAGTSELLLEFFVPVDLHWRQNGLSNFVFDPVSPESLPVGLDGAVTVEMDYDKAVSGVVFVHAFAARDGYILPGQNTSGSEHLTAPSGRVSRWFRFLDGDWREANQVRVNMLDEAHNVVFVEFLPIPGRYQWSRSTVYNISFSPKPTAVFDVAEWAGVTFDYVNGTDGPVRIWAIPYLFGQRVGIHSISAWLPPGAGTATRSFGMLDEPGMADQVRFRIEDEWGALVKVVARDVWYFWGMTGDPAEVPEGGGFADKDIVLMPNRPNPFSKSTVLPVRLQREQRIHLKLYDASGRLVDTVHDGILPAGENLIPLRGDGLAAGVYFARLETGGSHKVRRIVVVR